MLDIIEDLTHFGFSPTEAEVYVVLLKLGCANGSKIAKEMNISRSTVYQALNNLYTNGTVYLQQGTTSEYVPKDPDILITQLSEKIASTAGELKKKLSNITNPGDNYSFININGIENVYVKATEMISRSRKELLFNVTKPLFRYERELREAANRGVRIIVFSFDPIDMGDLPLEFYNKKVDEKDCDEERLQLVSDFSEVLVGSKNLKTGEDIGTYTKNPLQVAIVTEHIHHDIYLLMLSEKYGEKLFENVTLHTLLEHDRYKNENCD
jgi:sugar-specific transcriptional regulator TrmB